MFDYLTAPREVGRYRILLPRYPYVQNGLKENLIKHQTYYRERLSRVASDHLLVRLINGSPLPWSTEDRLFLTAASDLMYEVAGSLDLTTNVNRGKLHHPGHFYGAGVSEAIMVHDAAFDTYQDWRTLEPIRVHRHPVTDLHLQPLDGGSRGASGWAAISINFPMLMWVFRKWRDSDESYIEDYRLSVAHFVGRVILPSMMGHHLDVIILNRLYNDLFGFRDTGEDDKGSFYLIDYEKALDDSLEQYLSRIDRKGLPLEDLLASLPTVYHDTHYGVLAPPDVIMNSQTIWWHWVAYMPLLKVWCAYDYLIDNRRNRTERNHLQRNIARSLRSRWLPKDVESDLQKDMGLLKDWMGIK